MSAAAQIADLKAKMGVRSDTALANALRISKGTVSMWKRRGRVSMYVLRRADLMAQHGQIAPGESMERIASEIALLSERLHDMRISGARLAADLEQLAARARALGGDA
ncbi:helix-turn-helix domain-containing protein [Sphingobium yanoikuyae]|uniref:helix-turn-helix domain-containing protein n=1 Tax=Sphingobium yanoikuyae TaxID=13690 RepID=UPI0026F0ED03|nr:helix-turn-helix domain-containing protein [Sphingobium yanoikuyae]